MVETGGSGEDGRKPLSDELNAIQQAGDNHPFVSTLIRSVPHESVISGVQPQDALAQRFRKVRSLCKKVAMIDETGGTLYKYFVSYIQSLFMFSSAKALSDNEEVNLSDLNTFILVDNAAYCLEKGDLEQAVRYINQLRGEPRKVASSWLRDAQLLLETKQAADALLAHASAVGLGSLF